MRCLPPRIESFVSRQLLSLNPPTQILVKLRRHSLPPTPAYL